jgi:acyl-CoA dehydrogenase
VDPHGYEWMSREYEPLHVMAAEFFAKQAAPRRQEWRQQGCIDREFWMAAGELGLLCCGIPEQFGGGGASVAHDFAVLDAFVASGMSPASLQVQSIIVPHYVLAYAPEGQRQRWLPALASGRAIGAIAMTEPDAGSDLKAIRTRARRCPGGYAISGAKTFITNGSIADLVIVAAVTEPAQGARGLSLFLVDSGEAAGFTVARTLDKIGHHESDTAELVFDDMFVSDDCLLGSPGEGWQMLMGQLPQERLCVAVAATAAISRAMRLTVDYANLRKAFGQPLIDHQHVRFELAECATIERVAASFLRDCVSRLICGSLDATTAAMAKWWFSEMECQVVDRCLQLFGGYGYMMEYPIADLYLNARVQKIYGGTNEVMKEIVGRTLRH